MIDHLDEWLARKRDRPQLAICEARLARFKYARHLGPRGHFAVVCLRAEPAIAFMFTSVAEWPSPNRLRCANPALKCKHKLNSDCVKDSRFR
jgi:hypothetical protein